MDNNNKSTALVSVSDLSVVLQGVKRYIDSSKPNVSWDDLANGKTIHCDDWHHTMLLGSAYYSGVKIPTKAIVGNVVSLKNLKAESDLVSNGEVLMSKEDLQQMLPDTADITLSDNNIGLYDGCVVGTIEVQDFPFFFLFGEEGGDCVYLSISPVLKSNIETPLLSCDLVQDASLCPQDYVESSLGNANLKEDIKALSEKKPDVSWDDLYGGQSVICKECNEVEAVYNLGGEIVLVTTKAIKTNIPCVEGQSFSIRPFYYDDMHYTQWGEAQVMTKDELNSALQYPRTISGALESVSVGGKTVLACLDENSIFAFFEYNGSVYYMDGLCGDLGSATDSIPLQVEVLPVASLCPPSYVASSIGNESLEEDIKFLKENSGKVTIDGLVKQEFGEVVSGEMDGILFQGILTNIPSQEGVSFKLSNIRYTDDIRYYSGALVGEPEVSKSKEEANQLLHYPIELSGTIQYNDGQLVYVEASGNVLHALLDLGFDYMVYVDNFGIELTYKPFISYPLKLEVSSLISPDYIDSSLGKANLREDLESLHLGKTTKWVDTKIAKVGSDAYAGIPWKDEYQYPKAIRYILDGVEIDSENLPEGNTLTFGPYDYYGIQMVSVEVNGEPQFLYGDGSQAGVAGLLVLCSSDDYVLEKLELKIESVNTISSEFVDNMPYIGYSNMDANVTEVEWDGDNGYISQKLYFIDTDSFPDAVSINGEVYSVPSNAQERYFGNPRVAEGDYVEGDIPFFGMISVERNGDYEGQVCCEFIGMKPVTSVEFLQKEWRRKLPKEAIEGDDNESTDTFVAYNYLYLGNARVEGNKLYIDNAEVEDNKIILN